MFPNVSLIDPVAVERRPALTLTRGNYLFQKFLPTWQNQWIESVHQKSTEQPMASPMSFER
jgi:hypothetical protein